MSGKQIWTNSLVEQRIVPIRDGVGVLECLYSANEIVEIIGVQIVGVRGGHGVHSAGGRAGVKIEGPRKWALTILR